MARWTIQCAERYISILYDYLHREMYKYHLLQADETPVRVTKENRSDGSQHYMWVYRTVRNESGGQIVLYEYQPTRRADHPREFLKNFSGICITDGYQVYHTIESEREDLRIAGCYAHARRRFDEALKAVPEESRKSSLAYLALKHLIQSFAKTCFRGQINCHQIAENKPEIYRSAERYIYVGVPTMRHLRRNAHNIKCIS